MAAPAITAHGLELLVVAMGLVKSFPKIDAAHVSTLNMAGHAVVDGKRLAVAGIRKLNMLKTPRIVLD